MKYPSKNKAVWAFAVILSLTLFSGCLRQKKVTVLKLGHVLDINHPVHKAMVYMADVLSKKSHGTMRIDIYPNGELGSERDLIELLQIGSLAMTKVSASPLESFVPEMKVFGMPYVFRNHAHFWKVLNGPIGKRLLLAGINYRLRGLCYYDSGSRSFYTKKVPIYKPSDLKGLKIRVMKSQTAVQMIRVLGGSATPISWGELYTALQQGVVDGAENNPPSFYLSHHYEVCKYYSLDEHTSIPDILLISEPIWQSLSSQQQAWLQQAADASVAYQRKLWRQATTHALHKVQKAGVVIIHPDKALFKAKVKPMYKAYKDKPVYKLIRQIEAIR